MTANIVSSLKTVVSVSISLKFELIAATPVLTYASRFRDDKKFSAIKLGPKILLVAPLEVLAQSSEEAARQR